MTDISHRTDDRIELGRRHIALRWRLALTWFMRLMAVVWLVKGLYWWADIIGIAGGPPLDERRIAARAVAIGFAITDIVAAVGLWLTSVWGGLIWLASVTSAVILSVVLPRVVPMDATGYAINAAVIAVYLVLTGIAAREVDRL